MPSSQELYVRLVDLRTESGQRLFERLTIAQQLLRDHGWVADPAGGGGDESRAIDRLEDTAFGDLCGALSLPEMLEILQKVPQQSTWKANKYSLRRIHAEMKAREAARQPVPRRPAIPSRPASPEEQVRQLREEVKQVTKDSSEATRLLREENRHLKAENKQLRLVVKQLQATVASFNALQEA